MIFFWWFGEHFRVTNQHLNQYLYPQEVHIHDLSWWPAIRHRLQRIDAFFCWFLNMDMWKTFMKNRILYFLQFHAESVIIKTQAPSKYKQEHNLSWNLLIKCYVCLNSRYLLSRRPYSKWLYSLIILDFVDSNCISIINFPSDNLNVMYLSILKLKSAWPSLLPLRPFISISFFISMRL